MHNYRFMKIIILSHVRINADLHEFAYIMRLLTMNSTITTFFGDISPFSSNYRGMYNIVG